MSGMIFFGNDAFTRENLCDLFNGFYWDAFGELIDIALKDKHPEIHGKIKSEMALAFNYYKFNELEKDELEIAIAAMREEVGKWNHLELWQERAKVIWEKYCEAWILKDIRLNSAANDEF